MGFSWAEISGWTLPAIFQGSISFNSSSTKAETYAIPAAIVVCPNKSEVTVYIDSQNIIHTFHSITNKLTSTRRSFQIKITTRGSYFSQN